MNVINPFRLGVGHRVIEHRRRRTLYVDIVVSFSLPLPWRAPDQNGAKARPRRFAGCGSGKTASLLRGTVGRTRGGRCRDTHWIG